MPELLDDLRELLRIPSVSAGRRNPEGLRAAAGWMAERIRRAGGDVELTAGEAPIVLGELGPGGDAPTVLIYGHYDVQDVGPEGEWLSDPFQPEVRDGRLYARGASDDKGNFLPLLHAACELHAAGRLGVNVRVVVEGEEETSSRAVMEWVAADERGADCALVFDADMADAETPAITTACRGLVGAAVTVRVADLDAHSGLYGGAAMNAVHVLHRMLAAVLPDADGRVREELRAGVAAPAAAEVAAWERLPAGDAMLAAGGARATSPDAARDFHARVGAGPALDVNGVIAGATHELRTIIPAAARANVSMRLAPGQRADEMAAVLERLLREAAPPEAEVALEVHAAEPAVFDPQSRPLVLARRAFESATGKAPALQRSGGTIPILSALAARGIQTVVSGYALPEDAIHAPNESYRLESVELCERTGYALFEELAAL